MGTWKKAPQTLVDTFTASLPDDPRVERRQMFGYPCAFTGGQMFTGLHEDRMIVRLDEAGRAELLLREGAQVFSPMPGRVMREYVVFPPQTTVEERRAWLVRSLDYAASLPAKVGKGKKAAAG